MTQDGVYQKRSDCCAPWRDQPFEQLPTLLKVDEIVYLKDKYAKRFRNYVPVLPPQVEFPGINALASSNWTIKYDNTTCRNRCCRKATVHTFDCGLDWQKCSILDRGESYPPCTAESSGSCAAWVPCDINDLGRFFVVWGFLFALSELYIFLYVCFLSPGEMNNGMFMFVWFFQVFVVISSLSLVSVFDYELWASQSQVDMEFISYQSCVAYCNSNKDDVALILNKFCGDDPKSRYAVFEEDFNIFLSNTNACPSYLYMTASEKYCSKCQDHLDEWKTLDSAVDFLKWRTYVVWAIWLLIAATHLVGDLLEMENWINKTRSVYFNFIVKTGVFFLWMASFVCFFFDCYYAYQFNAMSGMGTYTTTYPGNFPARDLCDAFVAYDILFTLVALCLFESTLKYMSSSRILSSYMTTDTPFASVRIHQYRAV